MEVWPSTVPSLPTPGTAKGEPFRAPLKTDFEDGNRRQRRSTTRNVATYTFSVSMSNDEFHTFKAWVRPDGTTYDPVPLLRVTITGGTGAYGPAINYGGTFAGSEAVQVQAP